jgi:glycosyltransferase involved in cell wall biosynthesis
VGGLLIFCNDYAYFMAHRHALFSHLPAKGVDVAAYCGGMPEAAPAAAFPIRAYACDRYRLRPLRDLRLLVQMLLAIRRHRPAVVHTITLKPNLVGGLAVRLHNLVSRRRCRLVTLTAGLGRAFAPPRRAAGGGWTRRLVVLGLRLGLGDGRAVAVFENAADRDAWVAHGIVAESATRVVAGTGVDPDAFRVSPTRPAIPPLRVLFASRLLKSKGIEAFVDLAAETHRLGLQVEFVAAGRPDPDDADSVDLAGRALPPNLSYVGHVTDMPALLAGVHAVLLPSVYAEGLPRILIEAAATGCVLIASDIAGCRRIVRHGENGWLLPVADAGVDFSAMLAAVTTLAADPHRVASMGRAATATFRAGGFDIDAVRAELEAILFSPDRR